MNNTTFQENMDAHLVAVDNLNEHVDNLSSTSRINYQQKLKEYAAMLHLFIANIDVNAIDMQEVSVGKEGIQQQFPELVIHFQFANAYKQVGSIETAFQLQQDIKELADLSLLEVTDLVDEAADHYNQARLIAIGTGGLGGLGGGLGGGNWGTGGGLGGGDIDDPVCLVRALQAFRECMVEARRSHSSSTRGCDCNLDNLSEPGNTDSPDDGCCKDADFAFNFDGMNCEVVYDIDIAGCRGGY